MRYDQVWSVGRIKVTVATNPVMARIVITMLRINVDVAPNILSEKERQATSASVIASGVASTAFEMS